MLAAPLVIQGHASGRSGPQTRVLCMQWDGCGMHKSGGRLGSIERQCRVGHPISSHHSIGYDSIRAEPRIRIAHISPTLLQVRRQSVAF